MTNEECIYGNGIRIDTGGYLAGQMGVQDLIKSLGATSILDPRQRAELEQIQYGLVFGVDHRDLSQTGWGVIFPEEGYQEEKAALDKLIKYREEQVKSGGSKAAFKVYAYRRGMKKSDFLSAYNIEGLGQVDPELAPYYLLIAGSPEDIPFSFQYQLAVQFAVGRVHFDDPKDYVQYADNVIQAEATGRKPPHNLTFFGAKTPGDMVSYLAVRELIEPLVERLTGSDAKWAVTRITDTDATKHKLIEMLGSTAAPSLLFTESHGLACPITYEDQKKFQGALVCSDWPGGSKPLPEHFFAAADMDELKDANLLGMITFHFACYSAGTPRLSDYSQDEDKPSNVIAQEAFVSSLAKSLLARPNGALALIGHVERCWIHSFTMRDQARSQTHGFEGALKYLMKGYPAGAALEAITSRYADLACRLTDDLELMRTEAKAPDPSFLWWWTAHNDARAYTIIGDPAVRLHWGDVS